jgi:ATP-dependent Lon protease
VYFEPLTESQIVAIVHGAAKRLGAKLARRVPELIASYTIEGRKAVQILADAHGHALYRASDAVSAKATAQTITEADVTTVVQAGRLVPHTPVRARRTKEIGKTFGLGVAHHVGSLIELEAIAFRASTEHKGSVRFNEQAGTMSRDSVFNATSVVRSLTGIDPLDYDLHVNVIGGGNIDGPSAGLGVFFALYSAISRIALPQDVAMTGELSIAGRVRGVGGIVEKLYAARQAGMRVVIVPKENERDIDRTVGGIEIVAVSTVNEARIALGLAPVLSAVKPPRKRAR